MSQFQRAYAPEGASFAAKRAQPRRARHGFNGGRYGGGSFN